MVCAVCLHRGCLPWHWQMTSMCMATARACSCHCMAHARRVFENHGTGSTCIKCILQASGQTSQAGKAKNGKQSNKGELLACPGVHLCGDPLPFCASSAYANAASVCLGSCALICSMHKSCCESFLIFQGSGTTRASHGKSRAIMLQ